MPRPGHRSLCRGSGSEGNIHHRKRLCIQRCYPGDGNVYDTDRITFLRAYLTQLQRHELAKPRCFFSRNTPSG